jgi:hypothetical protein
MRERTSFKRLADQLLGSLLLSGIEQPKAEAIIRDSLLDVASEYGGSIEYNTRAPMVIPMLKRCIERTKDLPNGAALENDLKTVITLLERKEQ